MWLNGVVAIIPGCSGRPFGWTSNEMRLGKTGRKKSNEVVRAVIQVGTAQYNSTINAGVWPVDRSGRISKTLRPAQDGLLHQLFI